MPIDDDTRRFARLPPPDEIHTVVASATEEQFEFVRRLVQMTLVWLPILVPVLLADEGPAAEPFIEAQINRLEEYGTEPERRVIPALRGQISADQRRLTELAADREHELAALTERREPTEAIRPIAITVVRTAGPERTNPISADTRTPLTTARD